MPENKKIHNFYINEEQSIYLLSHTDAKKHKQWLKICIKQLELLGYKDVEEIGSGAFGFVFCGTDVQSKPDSQWVFKFSRITLAQSVRDRLEDEAYMLSQVDNPLVPKFYAFERIKKQGILMMARAPGINLEQVSLLKGKMSARFITDLALKLRNVLLDLRENKQNLTLCPIVHGDVKPSNLVWLEESDTLSLVDWGSSVFAQEDGFGNVVASNIMDLMSSDTQHSNARMGDVYFIGDEQMEGAKSSPRFDEQGVASTLYALASAQSCRFGAQVIPAVSLGLPVELAKVIDGMLSKDKETRDLAGDYFMQNMPKMAKLYLPEILQEESKSFIPFWHNELKDLPDTVVYSSRKSFLRVADKKQALLDVNDAQLDRYYREFLLDTGDTEKAFLASISRLAKFPVVGGLSFHWKEKQLFIESSLILHQKELDHSFSSAINNTVKLAQGIQQQGLFKCCLFDARKTIQIEKNDKGHFMYDEIPQLEYQVMSTVSLHELNRPHSYFEDGNDPDEQLKLPKEVLKCVFALNQIHHTGCIIFESLPDRLKVHHYYRLLDPEKESQFSNLLQKIMLNIIKIKSVGVAGFMKLPYKNTREFDLCDQQPESFFPKNPKKIN